MVTLLLRATPLLMSTAYKDDDAFYMEINEAADKILRSADAADGGISSDSKSPLGFKLRDLGAFSFICSSSLLLGEPDDPGAVICPHDRMIGFLEGTFGTDSGVRLVMDDDCVKQTVLQHVADANMMP